MNHFSKTKTNSFLIPIPPAYASKTQVLLALMENIILLWVKCLLVFFFNFCQRKKVDLITLHIDHIYMNTIILSAA